MLAVVFVFFLSIILQASARNRSDSCFQRFDSNPTAYAQCLDKPCLIFKESPPVTIREGPGLPDSQHLFPCRSRITNYKGLGGFFFSILDHIAELEDAWCMYLGDECSYNDLLGILGDTAAEGPYQFIASDCLFLIPNRLNNYSSPTVPYMSGRIVVYGRKKYAPFNVGRAIWAPVAALDHWAWIVFGAMFAIMMIARIWMVIVKLPHTASKKDGLMKALCYFFGMFGDEVDDILLSEPQLTTQTAHFANSSANAADNSTDSSGSPLTADDSEVDKDDNGIDGGNNRSGNGADLSRMVRKKSKILVNLNWLWLFVFAWLVSIYSIHYQSGIVNIIFNPGVLKLENMMRPKLLKWFAVVRDSASEHFLRLQLGSIDMPASKRWKVFSNLNEVVAAVRKSDKVRYALTFDRFVEYFLRLYNACGEMAIYSKRTDTPEVNAVWFTSIHVPRKLRTALNRRLTELVERGKILNWIRGYIVAISCDVNNDAVPGAALVLPTLLLLPPIIFIFYLLGLMTFRKKIRRRFTGDMALPTVVPT